MISTYIVISKMTDKLPDLTERVLKQIDKYPIIPLDPNIYTDDSYLDYGFNYYVNVVPDEKLQAISYSQLENYMNTVEHPGFTNLPRTNTQFSWYKKYMQQKNSSQLKLTLGIADDIRELLYQAIYN